MMSCFDDIQCMIGQVQFITRSIQSVSDGIRYAIPRAADEADRIQDRRMPVQDKSVPNSLAIRETQDAGGVVQ